jgi:hypothetical protein
MLDWSWCGWMLPFIWGTLRAGLAVIVDQVDRLFEVTADQGKAITFLPRIFADERFDCQNCQNRVIAKI